MVRFSFAVLGGLLVLAAAASLAVVGGKSAAPVVAAPEAGSRLPMGGLVLTSTAVELPAETDEFSALVAGPSADAVNAHCISCHSASMAMNQPRLTAAQWAETVTKMRAVFKAPIVPGDDPAIIAYLVAMQAPPAADGEVAAGG